MWNGQRQQQQPSHTDLSTLAVSSESDASDSDTTDQPDAVSPDPRKPLSGRHAHAPSTKTSRRGSESGMDD